jgi:hypothetical protein
MDAYNRLRGARYGNHHVDAVMTDKGLATGRELLEVFDNTVDVLIHMETDDESQ